MTDPQDQDLAALALQILEDAAVELHDPRLSYVTLQVDREDWEEWQRRREQKEDLVDEAENKRDVDRRRALIRRARALQDSPRPTEEEA